jgi:hypothetical protein
MYSKNCLLFLLSLGVGLSGILSLSGCSEFLFGKRQSEKVMTLDVSETSCLKDMPTFLTAYFNDQSLSEDVDRNVDCLQSSLKTFLSFTRGEVEGQYSDKELQQYFNRYFLQKNPISDKFMNQIMELKVIVVGGNKHQFTRADIESFVAYLNLVREQLKSLQGFTRLIFFRFAGTSSSDVSLEDLKLAQSKVAKAMTELLLGSKIATSGFVFGGIHDMMVELNTYLATNQLESFLKWFPLAKDIKNVFVGLDVSSQTQEEWIKNINWSVETYFLALEFYYQTRHASYKTSSDWSRVVHFADGVLEQIQRSRMVNVDGHIKTDSLDQMISTIWSLNVFKIGVSAEVIKNSYKKLFYHFIDGQTSNHPEDFKIPQVTRKHLDALSLEYEVWRQTQVMLVDVFADGQELPSSEVMTRSRAFERRKVSREVGPMRDSLGRASEDWFTLLGKKRPTIFTSQTKLALDVDPFSFKQSLAGLSLSSAIRSATRLALRGYGDRTGRDSVTDPFSLAMVESRIADMELNFREFGQAVGFLDPRQNNAPQRTFKEGNFFTFSGNGDARLDSAEIFELLHFMLSASGALTERVEELIEQSKGHLADKDLLGRPKSSEVAARRVLEERFSEIFDNMPQLVKARAKMSSDEWNEIYSIVMSISRTPDFKTGVVEYMEIRSFVSILQYVESLLQQFDRDRSGGLSLSELQAAEPRFHEIIKGMSPIKSERFVREAFIYLISRGKIPTLNWDSALDVGRFIEGRWRGDSARWSIGEASRLQLFRVLGVLKVNAL